MKKAAWVLPVFLEGSGGHRTMFQNIQVLAENGYTNDVYVEDKGQVGNEILDNMTAIYTWVLKR